MTLARAHLTTHIHTQHTHARKNTHTAPLRAAPKLVVGSSSDIIELMARGAANRATSETKMNDRSSRRHARQPNLVSA